ncbi:hypothetical protein ACWCYY_34785 [Kitasatospora sp. NPDC001664]
MNQPTPARAARRAARTGTKYGDALRTFRPPRPAPLPVIVRFLSDRSYDVHSTVGGIVASWAHQGERVLVLEEADPDWRLFQALTHSGRRKKQEPVPPAPVTRVLWEQPGGTGRLTHHTCLWQQGPIMQRDRSLLLDALEATREQHDLVVLLPHGGWSYPEDDVAAVHVALGAVDDFPHTDCRMTWPAGEQRSVDLTPEQSAAVLRDRCLAPLFRNWRKPAVLEGVVWRVRGDLPVDGGYLEAVDQDMLRAGIRSFGWAVTPRFPSTDTNLPDDAKLADPAFLQSYRPAAVQLLGHLRGVTDHPDL